MAKVLFINPVVREEDNAKHIPYGIALLAAIVMGKGHSVQIYDANAWRAGDEVLEQVCLADDWDVIAIGGLTTTYGYIKKACKIIKKFAPKPLLIAGGGFITSMPHEMMAWLPEIDLAVLGESFVSFPTILSKIDAKDYDFSNVLGVCLREKDGTINLTGVAPNIKNLDDLPYPAWDLFPLEIYFKNSALLYSEESFTSKRRIDVNGSLGCSLVCRYCWHLGIIGDMVVEKRDDGVADVKFSFGRTIRYHSARYIVDMVKELVRRYDIDFISFIDENMMTMDAYSNRTWMFDICKLWIEEGLQPTCRRDGVPHDENCRGVHWGGTSHATLHRKDVLEAMFKAGCSHLVYGLESFDPVILKNLGKGTTPKNNLTAVPICMATGIKALPNFIIGFPEESFESIRHTIKGLIEIGIHCKPHFATPYPGSEWFYTYKESILKQYNGDLEKFILDLGDASKITSVISHKFSALELLGLQEIVAKRDLRLLSQSEEAWNKCDEARRPVAEASASCSFERKKIKAPVEEERRDDLRADIRLDDVQNLETRL
jgi:radical SAM superfamily enzyme YgiQ (UPF0313 family)